MQYEWLFGTHVYDLANSVPFEVKEITGIDIPAIEVVTERGPLQDGDSDIDYRLAPRTIQMVMQARRTAVYTHEANRDLFNRMFKPSRLKGILRLTYDNGSIYAITARCLGNLGLRRSLEDEYVSIGAITLRCADPLWYDPSLQTVAFNLSGGGGAFTIPMPVPTFVGTSTLNQTTVVNYIGTYREFPTIQIYGPITDAIITNTTTDDKIDFTGYSIPNGSYYTIDLRYGRKFIYKNGDVTDLRTSETTNASNLATFALESDPDVTDGINTIQVTGSSVNTATQVYLQYYNRYVGI